MATAVAADCMQGCEVVNDMTVTDAGDDVYDITSALLTTDHAADTIPGDENHSHTLLIATQTLLEHETIKTSNETAC